MTDFTAIVAAFATAARLSGTAPRIFFITEKTSDELAADAAFVTEADAALAAAGLRRKPMGFAPSGITGVKAPGDENKPRVQGEGCMFCEWI